MSYGLHYWSCECTPSWVSDNEEECTEVTECCWMGRSVIKRNIGQSRTSPNKSILKTAWPPLYSWQLCLLLDWNKWGSCCWPEEKSWNPQNLAHGDYLVAAGWGGNILYGCLPCGAAPHVTKRKAKQQLWGGKKLGINLLKTMLNK